MAKQQKKRRQRTCADCLHCRPAAALACEPAAAPEIGLAVAFVAGGPCAVGTDRTAAIAEGSRWRWAGEANWGYQLAAVAAVVAVVAVAVAVAGVAFESAKRH